MRKRALGKTGLQLSEVGFGGWAIGGNQFGQSLGSSDDRESLAALNRAYELGCNLFVTSDQYGQGHSEGLIGQALKGWERDKTIIATQGGHDGNKPNFSAVHLKHSLEASLACLGVDSVDLYLLHTPPLELIQHGQVFETLRAFKNEGKVRFVGVSIQDPQEGIQAIHIGSVDVVMAVYNLFDARAEKQLFDVCLETQTGLLVREPLARGFLSGTLSESALFERGDVRAIWPKPLIAKRVQAARRFEKLLPTDYSSLAQFALAYALHHPAVSAVIPDCRTPEEVEQNLAAAGKPLDNETLSATCALQAVL